VTAKQRGAAWLRGGGVLLGSLLLSARVNAQTFNFSDFDFSKLVHDVAALPGATVQRLARAVRAARGSGLELASSSFDVLPSSETTSAEPPLRVSAEGFTSKLVVPAPISQRAVLLVAPSYESMSLSLDGSSSVPGVVPARLQALRADVALLAALSDSVRFAGGSGVVLASDFVDVSSKDLQLNVLAVAEWNVAKNATFGVGAGYSSIFGLPLPVPVVRASFTAAPFELEAALPSKVVLRGRIRPELALGLRAEFSGGEFRLDRTQQRLSAATLTAGPTVEITPLRGLVLEIDTGVAAWRRLRLEDADGQELYNLDTSPSAFLRTALSFAL
jgi:hypothetical protein